MLRLFAAVSVIWGHALPLTGDKFATDAVFEITGFDSLAGFAVKFFFFLSGLLIGNSLLSRASPRDFIRARFFRIWPALAGFVVIFALFVAPFFSRLSPGQYFLSLETWGYLLSNLVTSPALGSIQSSFTIWDLPGVFETHPLTAINGSLWTIPYEVFCYATVFVIWYSAPKLRKIFLFGAFLSLIMVHFAPGFAFVDGSRTLLLLLFYSGIGASLIQSKILLRVKLYVPLVAINILLWGTALGQLTFYVLVFLLLVHLSASRLFRTIRLPGDYSYGVYIWGWPLQQMLVASGQIDSILANQVITTCLALGIGAVSWHLIEKPAIDFAKSRSQ
jgi:peptidoglycan/LPS O-acetylase OafA/YrhL